MDTAKEFELKQRKYIPVFPKANGTPTVHIEDYPSEEEDPMPGSEHHGVQLALFYDQLSRYFEIDEQLSQALPRHRRYGVHPNADICGGRNSHDILYNMDKEQIEARQSRRIEKIRAEGKALAQQEWREWLERKEAAGTPFDEPPPS